MTPAAEFIADIGETAFAMEANPAGLRRSVHRQIADEIGRRIVAGDFPPGGVLPTEDSFSSSRLVSRTSYREAIKMLAGKGLVESRPKTGTRVRPRNEWNMLDPDVTNWAFGSAPDLAHARTLFEFRRIFEPPAAALAAVRRQDAHIERMRTALKGLAASTDRDEWIVSDLVFHQTILDSTGNELLVSLGHLLEPALMYAFAAAPIDAGRRRAAVAQHAAILDAIERRDADAARAAMDRVIRETQADLEEVPATA